METQELNILLVDDEEIVHQTIGDYLKDMLGHSVVHAYDGEQGLNQIRKTDFDIVLVDIRMPKMDGFALMEQGLEETPETSFVVITGHADMDNAIEALRRNAADFLVKPVKLEELDAVLEKALRLRRLQNESRHLRETIGGIQHASRVRECDWEFIGKSPAAQSIRQQITEIVASQCDSVLVTGETGTGKEVVARSIHLASSGESSPFIPVNCPAIPSDLVESELFGHTKGAFTGAAEDRAGAFELADGGTLFLDEIGDLSSAAQAALLRVLETRSFRRVGGSKERHTSLRVIAATNKPLEVAVDNGTFRRDLYYRLNLFHIHIPPLRERSEDIIPLAEHFRAAVARAPYCQCDGITENAADLLSAHDFPGNARELRNIIERACITCQTRGDEGPLDVHHLNHLPRTNQHPNEQVGKSPTSNDERSGLLDTLQACKWNRREAARQLDMPYSTLRWKIKQYGLEQE